MDIVPLGPGFAAELRGVTLDDIASDDTAYAAARAAFEEHSVLVFAPGGDRRNPTRLFAPLRPARNDQGRLAGHRHAFRHPLHHRPRRQGGAARSPAALRSKANQLWHTDSSFKRVPALASVLSARIIPAHGGETEYVSTRLAFERLGRACATNWKIPLPGTITRIRAARSRRISPPRRARGAAAAMLAHGVEKSGQRPRRAVPRLARLCGRRHGAEAGKQLIDELTEAATAPGTSYLHRGAGRRRDVGQPRDHASRPAMAGA